MRRQISNPMGWCSFIRLVIYGIMMPAVFSLWTLDRQWTSCRIRLSATKRLDCSNTNMTEIPSEYLAPSVPEMDLSNNAIRVCPESGFHMYSHLTLLDLHENKLEYIEKNCFGELRNLTYLDLRHNHFLLLENVPIILFQNMTSLKEIYISGDCTITTLPGPLFSPLRKLEIFSVNGLPLIAFPSEFQNLTSLREIHWVYGKCATPTILASNLFRNLRRIKIDTLSVVSKVPLNPLDLKGNLSDTFPWIKRLNVACAYRKLDAIFKWQESFDTDITELILDEVIPESVIESSVPKQVCCNPSLSLETLSLRAIKMRHFDVQCFKCLSSLKYLNIAKNSPNLNMRLTEYIHSALPHDLEVLVLSHIFDSATLERSFSLCQNVKTQRRFQNWKLNAPKLPKVRNTSIANPECTYDSIKRAYPDAKQYKLPKYLNYMLADNVRFATTYVSARTKDSAVIVDDQNSLRIFNVSNTGPVRNWILPVAGFHSLEILDISGWGLQNLGSKALMCSCQNLRFLHIANNELRSDLHGVFEHCQNLLHLDISRNSIKTLDVNLVKQNSELVVLHIYSNKLLNFNVDLSTKKNLRVLALRDNSLTHLPDTVMDTLDTLFANQQPLELDQEYLDLLEAPRDSLIVDLRENPLQCICSTQSFVRWVQTTGISLEGLEGLKCMDEYHQMHRIIDVTTQQLCSSNNNLDLVVPVVTLGILLLLTLVICFLVYKFRWHIKRLFYKCRRRLPSEELLVNEQFKYDAFVAHNHDVDRFWVINKLLPKVEEEWGMRLCVGYRDFLAGGALADTIVDAIDKSRKVIILVTPAFAESKWCDFEFNMTLVSKMDSMVIVYKESIMHCQKKASRTLVRMLKGRLYIRWSEEDENGFWRKLYDTLQVGNRNE